MSKEKKKPKKMCKWKKKDISDHLQDYVAQVTPVAYVCAKCGRVACKRTYVCKPVKVE